MKARKFFAFVAGAAMLFGGVACTPNEGGADDPTAKAKISLSQESAALTLEGGEVKVDITSNAAWTVEVSHDDVNITPASGSKNGAATITVPASTTPRTIEVKFTASKTYTDATLGLEGLPSTATAVLSISQNASGEIIEGGIASITEAGDYEIKGAWVVAATTQNFLMTDATGSYILVYLGSKATIPVAGTVVDVKGAVAPHGGLLQFGKDADGNFPVVTTTGETVTVNHGTPKLTIDTYAALDSYANNITIVYAEMKAPLTVVNKGSYNNYNLIFDGKNGYDDYKGSIAYAPAEIANTLNGLDGANIIARGYMIGVTGSVFASMAAVEVEVDASKPVLKAENISNVPATGVENATHNITVAGVDNVTATPDGTIVTAASVAGNVLTYTVAANTGEAREGKITLSAEGVNDVVVSVFQKGVPTGGEGNTVDDVLDLAFTGMSGTSYATWSNKTGDSGAVYAGQSAGGNESIQLRSNNSNSGVISTTSAGKVRKVVVTWNANTSDGRTLDIYGSNEAYTSPTELYGDNLKGSKLGSIVKGTSTELEIIGDFAYIGMRSNTGAMYLTDITITWEK